ncbi:insecticidal delta-endotoxin Cry8Ea1 family protein [Xanthovirga aplysinae]|uniref:insecticidal delta-endotoxin Cry8Ea1 family protein n=1 Tax=Xanthovirga aplysinae TaxID=2529853 RepID=UPI001657598B|nr:insecticidal delta-endotoxin Cry8Ea1 family protein [Xanthovirga aplysinae]
MKRYLFRVSCLTVIFTVLLSACQPEFEDEILETKSDLLPNLIHSDFVTDHPPEFGSVMRDAMSRSLGPLNKLLGGDPATGVLLAVTFNILFPTQTTQESPWDQVKEQTEALIDEKISETVYNSISNKLAKINRDYISFADASDSEKAAFWPTLNSDFNDYDDFTTPNQEVVLLPLLTQFVNLQLTFYRDTAVNGKKWEGLPNAEAEIERAKDRLKNGIIQWTQWVDYYYQAGLDQQTQKASNISDSRNAEQFNFINSYIREMTLNVLDFKELWPYLDPDEYPDGADIKLEREIYSDMLGKASSASLVSLPRQSPSGFLSGVKVWASDRINAIQITYPTGEGPNQINSKKFGGTGGSTDGGEFELSEDVNIIGVQASSNNKSLTGLKFFIEDHNEVLENQGFLGTEYIKAEGDNNYVNSTFTYPGHVLSSIFVPDVTTVNGETVPASVIFGFKVKDSISTIEASLKAIYLGSNGTLTAEDLASVGNISVADASRIIAEADAE